MPHSKQTVPVLAAGLVAFAFAWPGAAQAQAWAFYQNLEYQFSTMFPGEPEARDFDYATENGNTVPAREFTAARGEGRYSVTVVNFASYPEELEGAVAHAMSAIRAKGTPRYDEFAQLNGIPGHAISLVAPDGRQILAAAYVYETRLYIAEGSEAPGGAPPAQFSQSLDITYPDGTGVNLNPGGATTRAEILEIREREQQQQQEGEPQ